MGARGPAPCSYNVPTTIGFSNVDVTRSRAPAFSFGSRNDTKDSLKEGPGLYDVREVTRNGKISVPSTTIGSYNRFKMSHDGIPASNYYSVNNSHLQKGPSFSMGRRVCRAPENVGPPPNLYKVMSLKPTPGVTKFGASGRDENSNNSGNPSPNCYVVPAIEKYKTASPKCTLTGKNYPKGHGPNTPSPNYYSPKITNRKVNVSMKGRFNDSRVVCVTTEDLKMQHSPQNPKN